MNLKAWFLFATLFIHFDAVASKVCQQDMSKKVVQPNTCPGEGCKLGVWETKGEVVVFNEPGGKEIKKLPSATRFKATYIESHLWPRRAVALDDARIPPGIEIKKGQPVYVMSYHGEGLGSVCVSGKLVVVDVTSIISGDKKSRPWIWARYVESSKGKEQWWIKVEIDGKQVGWVLYDWESFRGATPNDPI